MSINNEILTNVQNYLQNFVLSTNKKYLLNTAFGTIYNQEIADSILTAWGNGDFNNLPKIEILPINILNGASAGYAISNNTIYIADQFLANNTTNTITKVLIEEIGHYLDAQINSQDTTGDEGELFAKLVTNQTISPQELTRITTENDRINIILNGQNLTIEAAAILQSDFEALVALYNSTNGANWIDNSGWNTLVNENIDQWFGVTIEGDRVISIDLQNNQLTGNIPVELGNLSNLQSLIVQNNQLTGNIPVELGNLSNLEKLFLSSNQLTGNIPDELGNLSLLQYLDLNNNQLTGSIPDTINNRTDILLELQNPPYFNQTFGPFTIDEKSAIGTIVGTIIGQDINTTSSLNPDTLTYSISGGNDDIDGDLIPAFTIDSSTGLITVNDSADLIYNIQPSFILTIQVTDTTEKFADTDVIVNLNEVTPPTVTINSLITNDNTPTLTGTIDDSSATINLIINSDSYNPVISGNTWSVNITNPLNDGIYDVAVSATDSAGNIGQDNTTNELTIDTKSPIVTINSLLTNDNTPTLTGTIDDSNATINLIINSNSYNPVITGNIWTVNITNPLNDGIYNVAVSATDSAGNIGQDNTTNELTIDTKSPIITINSLLTNDNTPTLTGTIDASLATITVKVNNIDYTPIISNNNWSVNITNPLNDGIYDVEVTAIDSVGNTGIDETTNELTVDTTAPVVTINSLITNDNTPTLTGTIDASLATITVKVKNIDYTPTISNNTWSVNITNPLNDGVYDVSVTAIDSVGNTGIDETTNELTVDTTAPVVTINSLITNDNTPTLTGTIDDSSATINLIINSDSYNPVISGNTWSVNITNPLNDGIYDVAVSATDSAGNIGQDNTTNELTIDTKSPIITINSLLTNDNTPTLTGTIDDSSATINLIINSDSYNPVISGNTWSVNITNPLNDGIYDVAVSATDKAGNIGQDKTTYELITNQSPVITPISQPFNINEKDVNGTEIGKIIATDANNDPLTYTIIGGNKDINGDGILPFNINSNTGLITLNDTKDLIFDIQPSFNLTIKVSDGITNPVSTTAIINVNKFEDSLGNKREDTPKSRSVTIISPVNNQATLETQVVTFLGSGASNLIDPNDPLFNQEKLLENQCLYTGKDDDYLIAKTRNSIFAGQGNDTIDGSQGEGYNRLFGGEGDDILIAGQGDLLIGENGKDVFKLVNNSLGTSPVMILDFAPENDLLDLSELTINEEKITFGQLTFDESTEGQIGLKIEGKSEAIAQIINVSKDDLSNKFRFQLD